MDGEGLGFRPVMAIHLLDDIDNILAHHILALSGNTGKWGKNMVGKNI